MHPTGALRLRRLHLESAETDEFACGLLPTGGLRPPLLLQCECLPAKNDFCDTHTHIRSRAAGVSPPWFENRTCEDNSAHIPTRPSHAAPRAAGVGPPWVCKPGPQRECSGFRRLEPARGVHPTGGLRPPLLLQCERLPAKNDFCDTHTHIRSGAAPVGPLWLTKPTCHAVRFTFGKPRLQPKPRSDRRGPFS